MLWEIISALSPVLVIAAVVAAGALWDTLREERDGRSK